MKIRLALALFFSFAIVAKSNAFPAFTRFKCSSATDVTFYPIQSFSEGAKNVASSVHLIVPALNSSDHDCSGSYISDQGHILTASHCLEDCSPNWNPESTIKCDAVINGVKTSVRVVLASVCKKDDLMKNLILEYAHQSKPPDLKKCEGDDDIAVILPDKKPENFLCLSLSHVRAQVGETASLMSYPMETHRPSYWGGNSDGLHVQFSKGNVVQSETCEIRGKLRTFFEDQIGIHLGHGTDVQIDTASFFSWLTDTKLYRQATVDIAGHSSGGPLINSKNEIMGVASFSSSASLPGGMDSRREFTECKGSSFFSTLNPLIVMSRKWNTENELSHLSCDQKRVQN